MLSTLNGVGWERSVFVCPRLTMVDPVEIISPDLRRTPMNIHLTPELETLVQNKVKSGRYNSASEVVREALRLFEERDRLRELQIRELQRKINEGWASLERGEGVNGEEFFRGLEREERELGRKRKRA